MKSVYDLVAAITDYVATHNHFADLTRRDVAQATANIMLTDQGCAQDVLAYFAGHHPDDLLDALVEAGELTEERNVSCVVYKESECGVPVVLPVPRRFVTPWEST